MGAGNERQALFDGWSDDYDHTVQDDDGFPFAGYQGTLKTLIRMANAQSTHTILDLGVGTGNLSRLLPTAGDQIWGIDFSNKMLTKAREVLPDSHLLQSDLLNEDWPAVLLQRYDRIISGYTLHEFEDAAKLTILKRLARNHLAPDGLILLADISFADRKAFVQAKHDFRAEWDEDEYYWCAEEMVPALEHAGFEVAYRQTSVCAGIYQCKSVPRKAGKAIFDRWSL